MLGLNQKHTNVPGSNKVAVRDFVVGQVNVDNKIITTSKTSVRLETMGMTSSTMKWYLIWGMVPG